MEKQQDHSKIMEKNPFDGRVHLVPNRTHVKSVVMNLLDGKV